MTSPPLGVICESMTPPIRGGVQSMTPHPHLIVVILGLATVHRTSARQLPLPDNYSISSIIGMSNVTCAVFPFLVYESPMYSQCQKKKRKKKEFIDRLTLLFLDPLVETRLFFFLGLSGKQVQKNIYCTLNSKRKYTLCYLTSTQKK